MAFPVPSPDGGNWAPTKATRASGARRYNASLHPNSRPTLTAAGKNGAGPRPYSTGEIYALFIEPDVMDLKIGDASTSTQNWYKRTMNWAFRFLYNPSSVQVETQIDQKATPTAIDAAAFFGQQQAIAFQLFINRSEELARGIQNTDLAQILRYGTNYDVNHLYRTINGDAGDVGFLINTLVRVVFGPYHAYEGFITNIGVQHKQFNADMVPMMSTVDVSMTRVSQFNNPAGLATDGG